MKKILLFTLLLGGLWSATAQAPVIEGDTMLCPNTNGTATITNDQVYDSYQWYSKYWYTDDEFEAIPGATSSSFTYDWLTYDQSLFKVVVTKDGETLESNTIQIDSWNWSPLYIISTLGVGVTINGDNGNFMICEGESVVNTINEFFINVQWYKDGTPIAGATQNTYSIMEPGSYYAKASPSTCPGSVNSTETQPMVAEYDSDCVLGIDNPDSDKSVLLYPNPAVSTISVTLPANSSIERYTILDGTGKTLHSGSVGSVVNVIDIASLAQGVYIIKFAGNNVQVTKMIVKQ